MKMTYVKLDTDQYMKQIKGFIILCCVIMESLLYKLTSGSVKKILTWPQHIWKLKTTNILTC